MNCYKCGNEFTKEDEQEGNYQQSSVSGEFFHIRCPGKESYWIEKRKEMAQAYAQMARDEEAEEANPSSWIVK